MSGWLVNNNSTMNMAQCEIAYAILLNSKGLIIDSNFAHCSTAIAHSYLASYAIGCGIDIRLHLWVVACG